MNTLVRVAGMAPVLFSSMTGASTPEQFSGVMREELDKWRNLARTANLKFD